MITNNERNTNKYDNLTGLPEMSYFFTLVEEFKKTIPESDVPAMIFFDLRGMKYFNRNYGFEEGNALIKAVGNALAECFGYNNCSRLAQDHFIVITKKSGVENMLNELFEVFKTLNHGKNLPVCAGVYVYVNKDVSADVACDKARYACDYIKNTATSSYKYFDSEMQKVMSSQNYILENFETAIQNKWITVYYQPIIRAANNHVCEEEALARWEDPGRGMISPGEFIPILENNNLVYKLDLFVIDCVLEKLKEQKKMGLHIVPQSINLSRSDFDSCDIVEEVRKRVDESGIPRDKINIEITESVMGINFEFMKEQVNKFRSLGFQIWIDDFGSGYSSFDFLQSIKFDVIKIDMKFIQQYGKSEQSGIILTELVKLATGLGMDTVAEGVETKEQLAFLKEIGCTKLQGFYYCKAIPMDQIFERYASGIQIGFENPKESEYYETLGRVNLYGLDMSINREISSMQNQFDTLPIAILEYDGTDLTVARSNNSYKEFLKKHFGIDENYAESHTRILKEKDVDIFNVIDRCHDNENKIVFEERLDEETVINAFLRYIAVNPVTGVRAYTIVILNIQNGDEEITYAHIANALSSDYINLYYVDIKTDDFVEYSPDSVHNNISAERFGENFFSESQKDALKYVYYKDRKDFMKSFTKENIIDSINRNGTFTINYRLMIDGKPTYVNMKAVKIGSKGSHIIIGVNNIDEYMKHQEELKQIRQERILFTRMMALAGNYIAIYLVELEKNDNYVECKSSRDYAEIGVSLKGKDFFKDSSENASKAIYSEDVDEFLTHFTKENVLKSIRESGMFEFTYRLMINNVPKYVSLKASIIKEDDAEKLIVGVADVDARIRYEQK